MLLTIVRQSALYLLKNVNFYFLVLFVYSFCVDVRINFFVCSFIRSNIIFLNLIYFTFYFILTFLFLYILSFYTNYTRSIVNSDWLVLMYRKYYIFNVSIFGLISYFFDLIRYCMLGIYNLYKHSFLFSVIFSLFSKLFSTNLWFPLFKRHSYFGYFRSMRQRWGDVKTEEANRLKY